MPRSSGGTYTTPAGNPVTSGTTISSAAHNNTVSDIAAELTDSLSRSGKGGMQTGAQLKADAGTAGAPGVSFVADPDCGLYRIGANNIGVAVNGAKVVDVATTGVVVTGTAAATGVTKLADGAVGAPGLTFTSDPNTGLYALGADNLGIAVGGVKVADVTPTRVTFSVQAACGAALPAPTDSFSDYAITGANTPICCGFIITGAGGAIREGYNIASAAAPSTYVEITLNKAINWTSATNYKAVVLATAGGSGEIASGFFTSATVLRLIVYQASGAGAVVDLSASAINLNFVVYGRP